MTNKKILQLKRIIELNNINRLSLRYNYDLPDLDLKRLDIIDARHIRWTRLYLDLIKIELKRRAKNTLLDELNKRRNGKDRPIEENH